MWELYAYSKSGMFFMEHVANTNTPCPDSAILSPCSSIWNERDCLWGFVYPWYFISSPSFSGRHVADRLSPLATPDSICWSARNVGDWVYVDGPLVGSSLLAVVKTWPDFSSTLVLLLLSSATFCLELSSVSVPSPTDKLTKKLRHMLLLGRNTVTVINN